MTTKNYSYYTFPRTPTRTTPSPATSRGSTANRGRRESSSAVAQPHTPPGQLQRNWNEDTDEDDNSIMASPTTTESKPQGSAAQQTPKTPTRPSRNSGSNTPQQKPGQQSGIKKTPSTQQSVPKNSSATPRPTNVGTPKTGGAQSLSKSSSATPGPGNAGTPKTGGAKKPVPSSNASDKAESLSNKAQSTPTRKTPAKPTAGDGPKQAKSTVGAAPKQASKASEQGLKQASGAANNNKNNDDGTLPKVSQAKKGLQEAAPVPIQDDEENEDKPDDEGITDDIAGGAKEQTEKVTDDVENTTDDLPDGKEATDRAGSLADKASSKAQQQPQQKQQSSQQSGGGLLRGAQNLAGRASGLAGNAARKTQNAPQDPSAAAKGAADGAKDASREVENGVEDATAGAQDTGAQAQKAAGDATDKAGSAVNGLKDSAADAAENAKDTAADTAEGAKDTAANAVEGAKDTAGDAKDTAADTAENAKDTAADTVEGAKDTAADTAEAAKDTVADAKDTAADTAGDVKDTAADTAEDAQNTAQDAIDGAQDTAEGATDAVGDAAEEAQDTAEDAADGAQDTAEDIADDAEETAEGAADDAQETAEDATGEGLAQTDNITKRLPEPPAGLPLDLSVLKGLEVDQDGTVFDGERNPIGKLAEGDAEDLEGYPIGDDGEILDDDGDLVGRVELLPDEIKKQLNAAREQGTELPDGADEYMQQLDDVDAQAEDEDENEDEADEDEGEDEDENEGEDEDEADEDGPRLPGLDILNGLSCQVDGLVYDDEGNTVGKVVDGDPETLRNATLNEQGEFVDEDGNVVGYADIHEDAADLVEQGIYEAAPRADDAADGVEEQAGDVEGDVEEQAGDVEGDVEEQAGDVQGDVEDQAGDAEDQVDDAAEEAEEAAGEEGVDDIADELPGIEALEGRQLNEAGEIVDDGGNLLGTVEDDELKQKIADGEVDPNGLTINESGEVVDEEGNVLGKTELAEGAAERLAGGPLLDLRILDGKKISKKGMIFDEEGEAIGELRDGELSDCAGMKVSEKGEVYNKAGELVGHVNVVPGEAAENATHELLEELGELQPAEGEEEEQEQEQDQDQDQAEDTGLPDLSILDGLKVNKKGQILNEDGEPIGELVEGELADCTGNKVNDSGEVLDKDGNVIGRVQTLAAESSEEDEQPEIQEEDEEEDEGDQLPPLSVLEGLSCNKAGKLIDADGNVVGELVEGDPRKLSKSGSVCDEQGQFWDNKGRVVGRAQTVPQEDAEEEAPFAGLEGLHVVDDGYVEDEAGNRVGVVVEGDWKKLLGRVVDEDGDVLDKKGTAVGRAERYEQAEEEASPEADLSFLQGKPVNKAGMVIGDEGVPVARLVEGKAKDLAGKKLDDQGQLWNDRGQVIGRVELIPEEEREAKPEGPFAGLEGLRVIEGGKVADESGNVVGELVEGNAKRLLGLSVDEDGDVMDRYGNVKGHAEPLPEEEEEPEVDNSILSGKSLNKQGYVVDENGVPFGRLVEGDAKELAGRRCDENGLLYNDTGKAVGRCEVIPEDERVARPEGPFAGLEGLRVVKEGWVEDEDGNRVGQLVEGNQKRLVGLAVDEDGDIIDKYGNVKGHAEPWDEPEEEEEHVDLSALAGCTINKSGNAVDNSGAIIGRVAEGDVKSMINKKVDDQGQIWDNAGNVVGRCELVYGQDTSPEGPFAGYEGLQIQKDGTVIAPSGDIVGRIIEGDVKKLMGHTVDEDGDIIDKNGNSLGKAERWEPDEKERRANPMSGYRVNKEGEVRDDNGDLIGKLTDGSLGHCVGQEIDDAGNVVDVDGNKIGECTLLENIVEDEYEGPSEEELEEARKRDEERQIAEKMAGICQQTLERVQPVCKQITEHMEKADRTPKDELDEEQLVNDVKPLIEEGGRILQECNGSLRGLDPDGKIAAQAKGRAGTGEATPEEYRLAETLKEMTTTVVTTIDNAKKRLNDMPHAKKKLNPLWGLLTQPLFQILAAVGLLLSGVLGLVGQLLNALGLGGLVNGLLGGLGIDKLLQGFGLMDGDSKKKGGKSGGSGLSNLPIVGGLLGGGK